MWLKRRTPQNIVIGGAAGAFPPLIGWSCATGELSVFPLILFILIFIWTPPHFWALALYKDTEYSQANIPMLPVIKGQRFTKRQIFIYSIALFFVSLSPFYFEFSSYIYLSAAIVLGLYFVFLSYKVLLSSDNYESTYAPKLFRFSILYLYLIFSFFLRSKLCLDMSNQKKKNIALGLFLFLLATLLLCYFNQVLMMQKNKIKYHATYLLFFALFMLMRVTLQFLCINFFVR